MTQDTASGKHREPGYYHVKAIGQNEWAVAFYSVKLSGWVQILFADDIVQDEAFIEIDERRIEQTDGKKADNWDKLEPAKKLLALSEGKQADTSWMYKQEIAERDNRIKELEAAVWVLLHHVPDTEDFEPIRQKCKAALNKKP